MRLFLGLLLAAGMAAAMSAQAQMQAPPENVDQLLNGYYMQREKNAAAAREMLQRAVERYPEDPRPALEYGYLMLQEGNSEAALKGFYQAIGVLPHRADIWAQIGYIEITLQRQREALQAFRAANRWQPDNAEYAMQLAYLQDGQGLRAEAAESFHKVAYGTSRYAADACRAWQTVSAPDTLLPSPWFGEFYTAPEHRRRNDVFLLPIEMRIGREIDAENGVDVYGSLRFNYDNRSRGADTQRQQNPGPVVVFDDAATFAGGIRARPWDDVPVSLFLEAGLSHDLQDRGRSRNRSDLRGGLLLYQDWNMAKPCAPGVSLPFRFVADFYSDAVYFSRYDDNAIFYMRGRPGLRLVEAEKLALDGYLHLAAGTDARNVDGNRFLEGGVGMALRLAGGVPFTLRSEFVDVTRTDNVSYYDMRLRAEYVTRF